MTMNASRIRTFPCPCWRQAPTSATATTATSDVDVASRIGLSMKITSAGTNRIPPPTPDQAAEHAGGKADREESG